MKCPKCGFRRIKELDNSVCFCKEEDIYFHGSMELWIKNPLLEKRYDELGRNSSANYRLILKGEEIGELLYRPGNNSLVITIMKIEREKRNKGYGSGYIRILEEKAKETGYDWIKAWDVEDNERSKGFWRKQGMGKIGETGDGYPIFGKKLK